MTAPVGTAEPLQSGLPVAGGWCEAARADPITGLVAFPDFHEQIAHHLACSLERGVSIGLAIGDVDHLKAYVEAFNSTDPASFGHLAGNALMASLGEVACEWFAAAAFACGCISTFGGDEVVLAAETCCAEDFGSSVGDLRDRLRLRLPRPVSFAFAVLQPAQHDLSDRPRRDWMSQTYLHLISAVDRALFARKASRESGDEGFVIAHDLPAPQEPR